MSYLLMTSLLSHQATVWSNEHNHYVYINTTTCVEVCMRQISMCASTSQGPARPEYGCQKHKTQFVPFPPKSGSFSSFSGIREELQFFGIFLENPVGLASIPMIVLLLYISQIPIFTYEYTSAGSCKASFNIFSIFLVIATFCCSLRG